MKLGQKTTALLLLVIALVLVTYLASQYPARLDFTGDRIYTLSDGTRNLLRKIEEPLTLQFYFSRSLEDIPIQFKNYATRVEEMLRQFDAVGGDRVTLQVIDPRPDTDEESAARRAGLTPQTPTGEPFFMGLVAIQGAEEQNIPFLNREREAFLEYDVAKLIYTVQQFEKPRLGLLSSLPLQGSPMPMQMPGQRPPLDQIVVQEWRNTFELVSVDEGADELPENLDVLAVIHPQNLSDKLQFAIDQFLLSGKPVFLAVDPSSYYFRVMQQRQQNPMMFMQPGQNTSSDLPRLLGSWGITYDATNVLGDLAVAMPTNSPQGPVSNPTWLGLTPDQFNAAAQPASSVSSMWLIEAGTVSVATDRGYEITPLITSSERSGLVPAMTLNFTPAQEVARQVKPSGGPKHIAVLVHGTFKTAFPEGAPKDPPPAEGEQADTENAADAGNDANAAPALKESIRPGSLVVVADSDWLLDMVSVQRIDQLNAYIPRNDNLVFAGNVVDFLGGSEDLIAIRGKGTSHRPFKVIRRMELAAQERYQAELEQLEARLQEVQNEINQLATTQTNERRLVATPEVQQAIERYRQQEADMQTERRNIRRALREGVEGLQNRLTLINVLLVPALILGVGLKFIISRSSRKKSAA